MFRTIKLIDDSEILEDEEKKELIDILKAQLSTPELFVLYYHVYSHLEKK